MLLLYDTLLSLLTWTILVPFELVRIVLGRSTHRRLSQRLGEAGPMTAAARPVAGMQAPPAGPLLVHAVSAGEMQAAGILVAALSRRLPRLDVVLTAGADDGLQIGEQIRRRCSQVRSVDLLPWDRRRAVDRFLDRLRPRLVVVVETEIWPALITACARHCIPLWLVSGRLSERDVGRYRLALGFFRQVLAHVSWIGVQNDEQRRRFLAIGAPPERLEVVGNLKYGAPSELAPAPRAEPEIGPPVCPGEPLFPDSRKEDVSPPSSGSRTMSDSLLVAVSTHHPEERIVLDAVCSLRRTGRRLQLVLAPRKVRRAKRLCGSARRRGLRAILLADLDGDPATYRRSAGESWDVLVVDRLGALAPWLAASDVVFVGGSLVPRGGHNPLEPAAAGCALVVGPFTDNFDTETAALETAGGLVRLAGPAELESRISSLLDDDETRRNLGSRAASFVAGRRPEAALYAHRVAAALADADAPPPS